MNEVGTPWEKLLEIFAHFICLAFPQYAHIVRWAFRHQFCSSVQNRLGMFVPPGRLRAGSFR